MCTCFITDQLLQRHTSKGLPPQYQSTFEQLIVSINLLIDKLLQQNFFDNTVNLDPAVRKTFMKKLRQLYHNSFITSCEFDTLTAGDHVLVFTPDSLGGSEILPTTTKDLFNDFLNICYEFEFSVVVTKTENRCLLLFLPGVGLSWVEVQKYEHHDHFSFVKCNL